jgi:ABC-type dipeptide/oligopeptide/nickel transport system ATPase component
VLFSPSHPYTRTLLASVPRGLEGRRRRALALESAAAAVPEPKAAAAAAE